MTPVPSFTRGALPALALVFGLVCSTQAQSVVDSATFFQPAFAAETDGAGGLISVTVDTTTVFTEGPQSGPGTPEWTHSALGLVEAGVVLVGEATLSTTTTTTGTSLVFGRSLELTGALGILNPTVQAVLGTSLLSEWDSAGVVSGLSLTGGNLYNVSFDITEGAGLDVSALTAANFSLFGNGNQLTFSDASTLVNLIDLISLGGSLSNFSLDFVAPEPITTLEFRFDATAVADASLLGGADGNSNVLTFTNLSVTPVPEPGSLTLLGLGVYFLLRRRNRQ